MKRQMLLEWCAIAFTAVALCACDDDSSSRKSVAYDGGDGDGSSVAGSGGVGGTGGIGGVAGVGGVGGTGGTPLGDFLMSPRAGEGLLVTEMGGQDELQVSLSREPSADVVVPVVSSDTSEGTVSPSQLVFTALNWNAPQTITVTGVDDSEVDGPQLFDVVLGPSVSDDASYDNQSPVTPRATCVDDETPGVTVQPTSGLVTTEVGGSDSFEVVLNAQPGADVTIALSSGDAGEGTVEPAELTFTVDNWSAPQSVTVTGVDDNLVDGDVEYQVVTGDTQSSDAAYHGLVVDDVAVSNVDNESAGFTVTPVTGLVVTEVGGQDTFSVVLNAEPTADVTVPLTSSDPGEGTVSPATLTFTASNWNAPQTVVVTGADDSLADGNQPFTIELAAATSTDGDYSGLDPDDVQAACLDDETAGVRVDPATPLTVSEAGAGETFTLVLNSQPTADVTIPLASSDPAEGVVSPTSVTFTVSDWNSPRMVTVTGVDDNVADGNQPFSVVTSPATSSDSNYSGYDAADVLVTNTDNDSAGITVTPLAGLTTTEGGGQATFEVVLNSEPTADVDIALSTGDVGEVALSPASLTFTSANWNAPQLVTLTGVDDAVADGNQPFTIVTAAAASSDSGYSGLPVPDVGGTNTDNDSAGVTVTPTSGLVTTEAAGQAAFDVVLNSEPTADVTIAVASSDSGEGTVSTGSLVFTAANWNAPQVVTLTGVDDAVADGAQPYSIVLSDAVSSDSAYQGLVVPNVAASNTDNDVAGVTVTPTGGLVTSEVGASDSFDIVLNSQPTSDVTIAVASSDASEGSLSVGSVVFTAANWNAPQTVNVVGLDDAVADGNQPFTIVTGDASSSDSGYVGLLVPDVAVTNTDDDSPGTTVSPVAGLVTTEGGGGDSFTIVLNSEPTADVTIAVSSSDIGEGTVSPATITFTALNWNAPQAVTVSGVDDAMADGNQPYTITNGDAVSTDPSYAGRTVANVAVSNTDNDSAGITVAPTGGLVTTEGGTQDTFDIVLNSQPSADVTITLSSSDAGEGTVSPASFTFTSANWSAPQSATVTGVDDAVADGSQPFTIVTGSASSTDSGYSGRAVPDVGVSNTDNDSAGITVTPTSGLVTTEAGGTDQFTVVLNSEPTANVTISIVSSDPGEGSVSAASLQFTPSNWSAPQPIVVTGLDDAIADGSQPFTIITGDASSTDSTYSGLSVADVGVSNTDNDSAGITVSQTSGLVTSEGGAQDSFTIVLNSQPTANVTIALSSGDATEGDVSPTSLTFTSANWNAPQPVTLLGVDDAVEDGNQPWTAVTGAAVSGDAGYSGRAVADVGVSNTDNDQAGVTVSPTSGLTTTEAGGQDTFSVVLNSQPTATVNIGVSSSDTAEGIPSTSQLVFTSANWSAPQIVTVTGQNDAVADGPQPYSVILAAATSGDAGYQGMDPQDVSLTNTDNDSAGITVTPLAGLMINEGGGQDGFSVVLNSQPTSDVTISVVSGDTSEGTASTSSLVFTSANWAAPQGVTITGIDDAVQDGNQIFNILLGPAASSDSGYAGRAVPSVEVANTDDDTAGVSVLPTAGLITNEGGGFGTFDVWLNSEPTADVTIAVSSNQPGEAQPDIALLTFTTANWNAHQTVTVTGQNDAVADGNQPFTIVTGNASSSDANYNNRPVSDVIGTNNDDDSAGISVLPVSGLTTTEAGGVATFDVVLLSEPTQNVTISVTSSLPGEGQPNTGSLTFTPGNWNGVQTVTVTGQDDALADGNQPYSIVLGNASSTDPTYANYDVPDVSLTNTDNDSAGIVVNPTNGLVTTEAGGQDTFSIVLTSEPTQNVTISLVSSNTGEGTVSPASVTFTSGSWNTARTVTLTGQNDAVADGNQPYSIITGNAVSTDPTYSGLVVADVGATNTDNDSAGITVTPTSGLVTSELGAEDTFDVVLNSQPTSPVTITVASSDTTEGTVDTSLLTFSMGAWNIPQTVRVAGVDDLVFDGNQPYTIITGAASSADLGYNGRTVADVSVLNLDNDPKTITVSPTAGLSLSESVSSAVFTVVLDQAPTANVDITLASNDTTEATVSPSSLTFTTGNWNVARTVTVNSVDDDIDDDLQSWTIITGAAVSGDAAYNGVNPDDVGGTTSDDDTRGISVSPTSGLVTTEAGGNANFSVVLLSEPTANVTINLASSAPGEGTVQANVQFTPTDWDTAKFITVMGVDDPVFDRDQTYTVTTGAATSGDTKYNGLNPPNVSLTNEDDEAPTFIVTPGASTITSEGGTSVSVSVSLADAPLQNVVLPVSSSDTTEGTTVTTSLTFTPGNYSDIQTIVIVGRNDNIDDGDVDYDLVLGNTTSTDPPFAGLNPGDVTLTNADDDTALVIVSPGAGPITSEGGGQATFTVRLATQPTGTVSIAITSLDPSEGSVNPSNLTFNAGNYGNQTVVVSGVDDSILDGDVGYSVRVGSPSGGDAVYNALPAQLTGFTNLDDERETLRVSLDESDAEVFCANRNPSITHDGKLMAFDSCSDMLVGGDSNGAHDVFVRDVDGHTISLISLSSGGDQGDGDSEQPSISADGDRIAFRSHATNLVPGDSNDVSDIFVHTVSTGQTIRVSMSSGGSQANGANSHPAISPDGGFVVFYSLADNLEGTNDTNGRGDIYLHNISGGSTKRVSVGQYGGELGLGAELHSDVSVDGKFVVFASRDSEHMFPDTNLAADVFRNDVGPFMVELVSWENSGARAGNQESIRPTISEDGQFVAFESSAADLVTADGNDSRDAFVRDMGAGKNVRASVVTGGAEQLGDSGEVYISDDAAQVVYRSAAKLSPGDSNGLDDIYRSDWQNQRTVRVNLSQTYQETSTGASFSPVCSLDGEFIGFASDDSTLVPDDTNDVTDVFRTHEPL